MKTATQDLTDRVARTLASTPDSTTCREALDEVQARLEQINERIKLIRPAPGMHIPPGLTPEQARVLAQREPPPPGAERAQAIARGDHAKVQELDQELHGLEAEAEVLHHQRDRLKRARTAAKVEEAVDEARSIAREVEGHVDHLEAASEAYTEARAALRGTLERLQRARRWATGKEVAAIQAGISGAPDSEVPGLSDQELLVRLRALLAKDLLDRPGIPKQRLKVDHKGRFSGSEDVSAPLDDRRLGLVDVVQSKAS